MAYDMTSISTSGDDGAVERIKRAKKRATKLFEDYSQYRHYCQTLAEMFWPERATFTTTRTPGQDMQDGLFTAEPQRMRRDLANRIGSVVRAPTQDWFRLAARPEEMMTDDATRYWCDDTTRIQRRILYDRRANYSKVMAIGDNDFVTFGNGVSYCAYSEDMSHLVFRPVHLANAAWAENMYGEVDELYERLKMPIEMCAQLFGRDKLPKSWRDKLSKPDVAMEKVTVVRGVYPIRKEDYKQRINENWRFAVCYYAEDANCKDEEAALRERFTRTFPYNVRRWQVLDEPFGRSPVTGVALSDASTLNVAEMSTLKSIEWQVDPPRWAVHEAVSGEVQFQAGGVTWVDPEGLIKGQDPFGTFESGDPRNAMAFIESKENAMALQFFETLWKFPDREMTAYEASERMQMIVNEATPVFQPMESDNANQMDTVFDLASDRGAFPPLPEALRIEGEVEWEFETPISTSIRKVKAEKARTILMEVGEIRQMFPDFGDHVDRDEVEREYLQGRGGENWILPRDVVAENRALRAQQMREQQENEELMQIADMAGKANPDNLKMIEGAIEEETA